MTNTKDKFEERYAKIKITSQSYCQSCNKRFQDIEIVFLALIDNAIICRDCGKTHSKIKPRLYLVD